MQYVEYTLEQIRNAVAASKAPGELWHKYHSVMGDFRRILPKQHGLCIILPNDTIPVSKAIIEMADRVVVRNGSKERILKDRNNIVVDQRSSKGGINRAKNLTPERRSEIAKKAAKTRWGKSSRFI